MPEAAVALGCCSRRSPTFSIHGVVPPPSMASRVYFYTLPTLSRKAMAMESINPATGERLLSYTPWKEAQLDQALTLTAHATPGWQAAPFAARARLLKNAAAELRGNAPHYARLITLEMGKLIKEARPPGG